MHKKYKCVRAAFVLFVLFCGFAQMNSQTSSPDYKNPRLPVERRVADLLSRMTLEEKIAQLTCLWERRPQVEPQKNFDTDRGDFSPEKAAEVMKHGIGQIARQREQKDPRQGATFANAVQ
jgi:beta-glucosidase